MNGEKIHCVRFADDIALVSESEEDMQNSLSTLTKILREYLIKIKTSVVTKAKGIPLAKLEINSYSKEQVKQFKYLGKTLTSDSRCSI